jgi:EAL domain-containing protein (putative c-di-GMP-specific phosphodiesterase class I)
MQLSDYQGNPGILPDIQNILFDKKVTVFFQQIVSVGKKGVCGLEGLIRGALDGEIIPPRTLFEAAEEQDLTLSLDRLCRQCVLSDFGRIYPQHRDKLLFMNIEATILERVSHTGVLLQQVQESCINPGNIVIEINEARVHDIDALKRFIDVYRSQGFLIALDDVGAGFSNLDRIPVAKPDIIKVDTALVRNIHTDYHRQEVFKSLIRLAEQIGALVVAEGVETEEEALQALRLGAHMIQGFYFSRPAALTDANPFENPRVASLSEHFRGYMTASIQADMTRRMRLFNLVKGTITTIDEGGECEAQLRRILGVHDDIESAFILDETGVQCCDAVFRGHSADARKDLLVCSLCVGTDHSMKNYYYRLVSENLEHYITEPYVSPITGSLCVTVSMPFTAEDGSRRILCLDVKTAFQP